MSTSDDGPRPSDKYIPLYFVAAFLLLFVIDGTMVYKAVSTNTGVVTDKPYEHGLAYNTYLQEQAEQNARGWKADVTYKNGALAFTLKGADGQPLTGAQVKAHIMRPVQAGMDFDVVLAETTPGLYISESKFPKPGLWNIEVSASWQNQPYRLAQELVIQP